MISAMLPRFLQNLAPDPVAVAFSIDSSATAAAVQRAAAAHEDTMRLVAAAVAVIAVGFAVLVVYAIASDVLDG